MRRRDLVRCQILGAVHNAATQSEGNAKLPFHRATKLRLAAMTDEELREFAGMIASRFGGPVDLIYKGFKRAAQNQKATMKSRVGDL